MPQGEMDAIDPDSDANVTDVNNIEAAPPDSCVAKDGGGKSDDECTEAHSGSCTAAEGVAQSLCDGRVATAMTLSEGGCTQVDYWSDQDTTDASCVYDSGPQRSATTGDLWKSARFGKEAPLLALCGRPLR